MNVARIGSLTTAAALLFAGVLAPEAQATPGDRSMIVFTSTSAQVDVLVALTALERLSDANRGKGYVDAYAPFKAELDGRTGRVYMLAGHFPTKARANRPVEVAEAFVTANRALFGLDGADVRLRLVSVTEDHLGLSHTRLAVEVHGVPVEGAELLVHSEGAMVRSVNAAPVLTRDLTLATGLDATAAVAAARDDLKAHLGSQPEVYSADPSRYRSFKVSSDPRLVYLDVGLFDGSAAPAAKAAWRLDIAEWRYFIDAQSGAVLLAFDNRQAALDRFTYSTFNSTQLPGSLVLTEQTNNPAGATSDNDVLEAYSLSGWAWDYYFTHHGRDSWDDLGGDIVTTVRYGSGVVNAFWNGQQLAFGDGDRMVQDDVLMHELTHGVIQATAGLVYMWQPGALNEAMADIFAFFATGDPLIGEGLNMGAIRDMSNPQAYGQPEDMSGFHYLPRFIDNGGVHTYSSIPAHAAYLMTVGGQQNGITIQGQGLATMEAIWYRALTLYMYPVSNFSGCRASVELACADLHGSTSATCHSVADAFEAQGIY